MSQTECKQTAYVIVSSIANTIKGNIFLTSSSAAAYCRILQPFSSIFSLSLMNIVL